MDYFLACHFFCLRLARSPSNGWCWTRSPPLDVNLNQLLQVIHAQVRASAQRDEQLKALLETVSSRQPPAPVVSPAPTLMSHAAAPKPIAFDRPTLLSSATLADFTAWSEAWDGYARCQLLATQPLSTRMSAFRQTLDKELRRFIREGIISIPDTWDVQEAKDKLRKFIRRQRNPLLDSWSCTAEHSNLGNILAHGTPHWGNFFTPANLQDSLFALPVPDTCTQLGLGLSALTDDILRDRIVTGVLSDEARHKLLATKDLTLKACVDLCRAEEAANHTGSCLLSASQALNGSSVNVVKSTYQKRKQAGGHSTPTQPQKHLTWRQREEVPKLWSFGTHQKLMPSSGSQMSCLPPDWSFFVHASFFSQEDGRCAETTTDENVSWKQLHNQYWKYYLWKSLPSDIQDVLSPSKIR